MEDCLKGILVNNGVSYIPRKDHSLNYYVGLVEQNGLVDAAQLTTIKASVQTITKSGSDINFRYPELDPAFFQGLPKSESEKRASAANDVLIVARAVVH